MALVPAVFAHRDESIENERSGRGLFQECPHDVSGGRRGCASRLGWSVHLLADRRRSHHSGEFRLGDEQWGLPGTDQLLERRWCTGRAR